VTAEVQLVAEIGANLTSITTALSTAEQQIEDASEAAGAALADEGKALLEADIAAITADINQAVTLIKGIQATISVAITDLTPGKFYLRQVKKLLYLRLRG
jgi:hypothetical protein